MRDVRSPRSPKVFEKFDRREKKEDARSIFVIANCLGENSIRETI